MMNFKLGNGIKKSVFSRLVTTHEHMGHREKF